MTTLLKIHDGTAQDGPSLCNSCTNGIVIKGGRQSDTVQICLAPYPNREITFKVIQCSDYHHKNSTKLRQMEDIAWKIEQKNGRVVGFMTPAQAKEKENKNRDTLDDLVNDILK